ncbi:MAG: sigma-70 family RNA polymerase sigma factor [Phycisphaerales bacterium]
MAEHPSNHASSGGLAEDRALLRAMHAGDERAARELWSRFAGRLRVYARSLSVDADADDLVQGVFLEVLRLRRSRIRAVKDPAAWLCTLTRNAAMNDRRSHRRRCQREASAGMPADRTRTASDHDDASLVLERVPQPLREAVVLRHAYGFTLERLADALGVSRSTAADRYSRGLALARELAAEPVHPPARLPEEPSHAP